MKVLATVLYEDKMAAGNIVSFPLHDLVMRMVEDNSKAETWRLRKRVKGNPRKGIDKVIKDLENTDLIAGAGKLYLLVDRDRVAEHLKLPKRAPESEVVEEMKSRSDAPDKVEVFFLDPNVEGLLRAIRDCDGTMDGEIMQSALRKKLIDRDIVLRQAKSPHRRSLRDCVRVRQKSLGRLVEAMAGLLAEPASEAGGAA